MATVGVVGLGRSGYPLALLLASAGHIVHVWDHDADVRAAVMSRAATHIDEPSVGVLAETTNLIMTPPDDMTRVAAVVFAAVPTMTSHGDPTTAPLHDITDRLGMARRPSILVVTGLTGPGVLTELAGRIRGSRWRVVHWPILAAPGRMVHGITMPDAHIVGHASDTAAATVCHMIETISTRPIHLMGYEGAAIASHLVNVWSAAKISLANLTARMCADHDVLPDVVLDAMAAYGHIGAGSLDPGVGYDGPYLTASLRAVASWPYDVDPLVDGITVLNGDHATWIADRIILAGARTYTVVGRSTAPGRGDFLDLVDAKLAAHDVTAAAHVGNAEALIIAQPLKGIHLCEHLREGCVVIDLYRTHPYLHGCAVRYVPFGPG